MNNLSWLLYLADVLHNVGFFFAFIAAIGSIGGVIVFVISFDPDGKVLIPYRHSFVGFLLLGAVSMLFPSKDTMYAIAASEMGEEVLNSRVGTKAQRALESWLDAQIKDEPKKAADDE